MRTASILLASVVVLGFVSEAGASYWFDIGDWSFGFIEFRGSQPDRETYMILGPLGQVQVPFTATQGLVGFCFILAMLIIVPVILTVRWKKKRTR